MLMKPQLIIHDKPLSAEEIEARRRKENMQLTPAERFYKAFQLMELAMLFSPNGIIKKPQGKGIILKPGKQ